MRFYDIGGDRLPSVTTILDNTMSAVARFHLDRHYAKGGEASLQNHAAQLRGNMVDTWAKAYLKGDRLPEMDWHIQEYCNRVEPVLSDLRMNSGCESDVVVANVEKRYAGTIDVLITRPELVTVWEFKTKSDRKWINPNALESALLQAAAYVAAGRSQGRLITDAQVCFILKDALTIHHLEGETLQGYITQFEERAKRFGVSA